MDAPMAAGRPKPMVPKPPEEIHWCGGTEGVLYKNVVGTYLHGPLLPKNPHISDYLIKNALKRKYGTDELAPLDDTQELEANASIYQRFVK